MERLLVQFQQTLQQVLQQGPQQELPLFGAEDEEEQGNNLSNKAIVILRVLHQHTGRWTQQIESLPEGEKTILFQKLRRQLDVLDELMVLGRRKANLLDQIRIMTLLFVKNELYYLI